MSTFLDLLKDGVELRQPRPLYALSLSGGGYRGLYTAAVLSQLEKSMNLSRIGDCFDLFSGTSVGGIVAAALAMGIKAETIQEGFITHGRSIFDPWIRISGKPIFPKFPGPAGGLLMSKFRQAPLRAAIVDILGPDKSRLTISGVEKPLILVATCATTKRPVVISNCPSATTQFQHLSVVDALLASSAAPGFFEAVGIEGRSLVDGGLVANAPDLVALTHILKHKLAPISNCRMLSIGTAAPDSASVPKFIGSMGLLHWISGDLLPLVLEAQERIIVDQLTVFLGENYYRINSIPAHKQASFLTLDSAGQRSIEIMKLLAIQSVDDLPSQIKTRFMNPDSTDTRFDIPRMG